MPYRSLNTGDDGEGRDAWVALGRPLIPSLVLDEQAVPILHISQVAKLLDLPGPDTAVNARLAWDTVTVLTSWMEQFERMSWELLNQPTPSRDRSIRNLTVNVFHPFELLPEAWSEGRFHWEPDDDHLREATLASRSQLRDWANGVLVHWQGFLLDHQDRLEHEDHEVETPRGAVPYSVVLTSQRYHAAAHHRQLVHFLRSEGFDMDGVLDVERLPDIDLAPNVF